VGDRRDGGLHARPRRNPEWSIETAAARPQLSVIVPSVNGFAYLEPCLAALAAQEGGVRLEVLVADRLGEELRRRVAQRFPDVRILPAPSGTTIPQLRALALRNASAPSVAVIEDHVMVPPDWARRMLEARRQGAQVVGGGVAYAATDRLVDRAAFFCEYGHMLGELPEGPAEWLTGNNTVYDRELLASRVDLIEKSWEDRLHSALREAGVTLVSRPDIVVGHDMHYTVLDYFAQRYLYSRSFSGARSRQMGAAKRVVFAGATVLLPPILLRRIVGSVWRHPAHRADLIRSLPAIALWTLAWAAGDAVGFLFGPGTSLQQVR
jgi:glycosyltransferase involved in cell wall biosynthesis